MKTIRSRAEEVWYHLTEHSHGMLMKTLHIKSYILIILLSDCSIRVSQQQIIANY